MQSAATIDVIPLDRGIAAGLVDTGSMDVRLGGNMVAAAGLNG
jgi:hypothetical protein